MNLTLRSTALIPCAVALAVACGKPPEPAPPPPGPEVESAAQPLAEQPREVAEQPPPTPPATAPEPTEVAEVVAPSPAPRLSWESAPPDHEMSPADLASAQFSFRAEPGASGAPVVICQILLDGTQAWSVSPEVGMATTWRPPQDLQVGKHRVQITALDASGEPSEPLVADFYLLPEGAI